MRVTVQDVDAGEYRNLLEPFESVEEANDSFREFFREIQALRVKHGFPDVTVVIQANVVMGNRERVSIACQHHGHEEFAPRMLGEATKLMKDAIAQIEKGAAKRATFGGGS